nr:hypothetical protein Iba_chr04aCG8380 [Ipomoea batatas]GMC84089.1 hypothetical protein Iba_chr04cCG8280 [Ipomoea batatas]
MENRTFFAMILRSMLMIPQHAGDGSALAMSSTPLSKEEPEPENRRARRPRKLERKNGSRPERLFVPGRSSGRREFGIGVVRGRRSERRAERGGGVGESVLWSSRLRLPDKRHGNIAVVTIGGFLPGKKPGEQLEVVVPDSERLFPHIIIIILVRVSAASATHFHQSPYHRRPSENFQ